MWLHRTHSFQTHTCKGIEDVLALAPVGWDVIYLGYHSPMKATYTRTVQESRWIKGLIHDVMAWRQARMEPVTGTQGKLARPEYLHHTHAYLCSPCGASKLLASLPVDQVAAEWT